MFSKLHSQFASVKQRSVQSINRVVGVALVKVTHKREAATVLSVWIAWNIHVPDVAVLLKHLCTNMRTSVNLHVTSGKKQSLLKFPFFPKSPI